MKKFLVPLLLTMLLVVGISAADQTFNYGEQRFFSPNPTAITSVTANYTATANDHMIKVNAASGPITITLTGLSSTPNADSYIIQKTDTTPNPVIVKASTTDTVTNTIEGKAQRYLTVTGYMSVVARQGYDWKVNWETSPIIFDMSAGNPVSILSAGISNRVVTVPTISTTYTSSDCGKVIASATDALTFTLPQATTSTVGCVFTFVNTATAGAAILDIKPNAADSFFGTTFAATATPGGTIISSTTGSTLSNTKSTAKKGDTVTLTYTAAATIIISNGTGTWTMK